MLRLFRGLLVVIVLATEAALGAATVIDGAALGGFRRLDEVSFLSAPVPELRGPAAGQLGAFYQAESEWLSPEALAALGFLPPAPEAGRTIQTRRGGYFDLWNAFFAAPLPAGCRAARVSFEIRNAKGDEVFLLLGGNDCCAVFVEGRAIWGIQGKREHIEAENAVRIPLSSGAARVDVLSWKATDWSRVPDDHFENEWSLNLALSDSEGAAWRRIFSQSSHFLEAPIVGRLNQLQATSRLPHYAGWELYDLQGVLVARGQLDCSGHFVREQGVETLPDGFVGVAVLGGALAEAVVVTGERPLDEFWPSVLEAAARQVPSGEAWAFRCRHLFKPEFLGQRDRWWARKAALSLAMAGLRTSLDFRHPAFQHWKSAYLELGEYRSKIDGTRQHYRAAIAKPAGAGEPSPLVVILPGVPFPVRPFLESYTMADLKGSEEVAALARDVGCDVLWPGVVDIDYGGSFARVWVREAIQAFLERHPAGGDRRIYLVGTCSAGAGALGYTGAYGGVDGVVLWSPVVARPLYRWPFKDQWPLLPRSVMAAEAVKSSALRRVPVFLLFDHDEPGHGDRPGAAALCHELQYLGGAVDEEWVDQPDHRLVWGMRATLAEQRWLQWIANQAAQSTPRALPRRHELPANTIKNVLLRGFALEPATQPVARAWIERWTKHLLTYRGAAPETTAVTATATPVLVRSVGGERFVAELGDGFSRGEQQLPATAPVQELARLYNALFGVRLQMGDRDRVEVWCDERSGSGAVPEVDLFREGCCQAALWGWREGRWELIQAWL